jgi:uncharacterized protein (TIGR03000 family)
MVSVMKGNAMKQLRVYLPAGLLLTAALLAPPAAHAQVRAFGLGTFGRPFGFPYYSPWGGLNGPYTPGFGGTLPGSYGYPYGGGYGSPYGGGYGYTYGAYNAYPWGASTVVTIPLSPQPYMATGLSPVYGYSAWTGGTGMTAAALPTTPYYSGVPRMRDRAYPGLTTALGTTARVPSAYSAPGALVGGAFAGAPALPRTYAPAACASMVGGCLAPSVVAYSPVNTVTAAYVSLEPPPRMREAYYQADLVRQSGLASSAYGTALRRAQVELLLPAADADVWFDGVKMRPTGRKRHFWTPPLDPGGRYSYHVRVRWQQGGQERNAERNIQVRAGQIQEVVFTADAGK